MLLQGRSGSEIMRPGAKPAPRSHRRRRVLMAQECLPRRRPPLFLTILFQREGHCCAVHAEFTARLVHFLSLWMHIPQRFPPSPPPSFSFFPPPADYGTIRKVLSPLNLSTGSCLLEEIELFPPRKRQPIRSLLILHSRSELYVGVRDQVIKIPLKRCSYHKSRE